MTDNLSNSFKIVLKRQSGDKYEIKSTPLQDDSMLTQSLDFGNRRPRREAAKRVKFSFNENNEYDIDDSNTYIAKKRIKSSNETTINKTSNIKPPNIHTQFTNNYLYNQKLLSQAPLISPPVAKKIEEKPLKKEVVIPAKLPDKEVVMEFRPSEILKYEKQMHTLKQPCIKVIHSVPFLVALCENTTNIVYTKAILLMHLHQSYTSPCIMCVLCKSYFNISEFSKHFHLCDDDLSSDSEFDERDPDEIPKVREKKMAKLKKNQYKVMPYCTGDNKLSEDQLKVWKQFRERHEFFKQQKKQSELKSQAQTETNEKAKQFNDWDYANAKENRYQLDKSRLDNEKIVYVGKKKKLTKNLTEHNSNLSDTELSNDDMLEEDETNKTFSHSELPKSIVQEPIVKTLPQKVNSHRDSKTELALSESESESDQEENLPSPAIQKQEVKIEKIAETTSKVEESYFYDPALFRKRAQMHFNLYDNSGIIALNYWLFNQYTIVPQMMVDYEIKVRREHRKEMNLARSEKLRMMWLCLNLDLECNNL